MTPELERPPALPGANAQFVTDRLAVGGDLDMYDEGLAARQVTALTHAGIRHVPGEREGWSDEHSGARGPGVP